MQLFTPANVPPRFQTKLISLNVELNTLAYHLFLISILLQSANQAVCLTVSISLHVFCELCCLYRPEKNVSCVLLGHRPYWAVQ